MNSALLILASTGLIKLFRVEISGLVMASVFLMGGFALFGKNIFNVWPIIIGTYLYSLKADEDFKNIIHIAFFATSIAPIVTELLLVVDLHLMVRIVLSVTCGISIGYLITPLSRHLFNIHKGFNLYNIGFSIGLLSIIYVSLMRSFGYQSQTQLLWSEGNNRFFTIWLGALFSSLFVTGLYFDEYSLKNLWKLLKQSGYDDNDYLQTWGFGTTLMNMALNGFISLIYILLIGGSLNGPTIGGILTVVGFGGAGKHIRLILPIFIGVYLGALTNTWELTSPSIIFAALFGTALTPIAGHYGFIWGVFSSYINASVAVNLSYLHAGMNLYNTGFSVGIVTAILVPLLDSFKKKRN